MQQHPEEVAIVELWIILSRFDVDVIAKCEGC